MASVPCHAHRYETIRIVPRVQIFLVETADKSSCDTNPLSCIVHKMAVDTQHDVPFRTWADKAKASDVRTLPCCRRIHSHSDRM
jgi:hypothetical protein